MEESSVNPYCAPQSDLTTKTLTNNAGKFKRFSAWGVFGLTIITLGIYPIYWIYTRSNIANSINDNKIPPILLKVFIALTVASFIFGVIESRELAALAGVLNIAYFVVYLISLFKLKISLEEVLVQNSSPVLTFFGNAIYLQYKINQAIDNASANA